MRRIHNEFKIPFFPMENKFFLQFIDKFLKFEVMEYISHSLCLKCKQLYFMQMTYLFSTVTLKLGATFSEFIHRFKIGIFDCWFQIVLPSFFHFTKRFWYFSMLLCSPWGWGHIGIKLATIRAIYQKFANFMQKKDIYVNRFASVIFAM